MVLGLMLGAGAATAAMPDSFADLADRVTPAVVTITTSQEMRASDQPDMPFAAPPGSPFEEFFRRFQDPRGGGQEQPGQHKPGRHNPHPQAMAQGSGFIIDAAGYIVTNNHVIDSADEITAVLKGGEEYKATLVGRDIKTDLALLKIDAGKPLPTVAFGDSDRVRVGDWVMAVGNPFGLGGTVTVGVVSARGRDLNAGPFDDFLQVDAPINRGNSGGPLFDTSGAVVGINSAIASPNGGSVGIGFAIPAALAQPIIAALKDGGNVIRGWLGVQIQGVTPDIAEAIGLDRPRGALVAEVQENSPASKVDLKSGDVILTFAGQDVAEMRDLPRLVADTPVGQRVVVTLWRNRAERTVEVAIEQLKDDQVASAAPAAPTDKDMVTAAALGATLAALTPQTRARFDLPDEATGVLVVDVDESGPAARDGLRPGDLIQQVSAADVADPAQVNAAVERERGAGRKAILLLIDRGGDALFVAVKTV
jgi:serine protease Do